MGGSSSPLASAASPPTSAASLPTSAASPPTSAATPPTSAATLPTSAATPPTSAATPPLSAASTAWLDPEPQEEAETHVRAVARAWVPSDAALHAATDPSRISRRNRTLFTSYLDNAGMYSHIGFAKVATP